MFSALLGYELRVRDNVIVRVALDGPDDEHQDTDDQNGLVSFIFRRKVDSMMRRLHP
jgi:hypothetical protein